MQARKAYQGFAFDTLLCHLSWQYASNRRNISITTCVVSVSPNSNLSNNERIENA